MNHKMTDVSPATRKASVSPDINFNSSGELVTASSIILCANLSLEVVGITQLKMVQILS